MNRFAPLLVAAIALTACKPPPPPAPEGLDESAAYMVRNFYADDATFHAGLVGFMNWFDDEGNELIGADAMNEGEFNEAFTVGRLSDEDVALLPLEHGRTVSDAAGIVSVADMACTVTESEDLLVRADQDTLFVDDWDEYERTYVSSRSAYQDATREVVFAVSDEDVDRFGEDFDDTVVDTTFLLTHNVVTPAPLFGIALLPYPMALEFRHGEYDIDGETLQIYSIITWIAESASGAAGDNHLYQSYSIEINAERPDTGTTLRMLAVWAEPGGAGIEPDDPFVLNFAVRKSAGASARLAEICNGDVEVDDER
jgi:hypothetical protein